MECSGKKEVTQHDFEENILKIHLTQNILGCKFNRGNEDADDDEKQRKCKTQEHDPDRRRETQIAGIKISEQGCNREEDSDEFKKQHGVNQDVSTEEAE